MKLTSPTFSERLRIAAFTYKDLSYKDREFTLCQSKLLANPPDVTSESPEEKKDFTLSNIEVYN